MGLETLALSRRSGEPRCAMINDDLLQRIEIFADAIGEHCDGLLILATVYERGETICLAEGRGNHLLREGLCRDYLRQLTDSWSESDDDGT